MSAIKLKNFVMYVITFVIFIISLLCSFMTPHLVSQKMVIGYLISIFLIIVLNFIIFKWERRIFFFSICLTIASLICGCSLFFLGTEFFILFFLIINILAVLLPYFWIKKFYKP